MKTKMKVCEIYINEFINIIVKHTSQKQDHTRTSNQYQSNNNVAIAIISKYVHFLCVNEMFFSFASNSNGFFASCLLYHIYCLVKNSFFLIIFARTV